MLKMEILGNLVADPITRTITRNDTEVSVTNFRIAINTGSGENRKTTYVDCAAWRGLGEVCQKYLTKGRQIWASGIPSVDHGIKDGVIYDNLRMQIREIEFCGARHVSSAEDASVEEAPQA